MSDTPNNPDDDPFRANRGILVIVIALGAAIVIGVGALIYGILQKSGKSPEPETADVQTVMTSPSLPASPDTAIRGMMAVDGILYLHIQNGKGREILRAYDGTGRMIFEIDPVLTE